MEFMFGDWVRYGYGFANPNHAAALICSVLPFVWLWEKHKYLSWILTFILLTALAATYSRTGILVVIFEFILFYRQKNDIKMMQIILFAAGLIAVSVIFGVIGRFVMDKSVSNRPLIYIAGLKIFAANPWGVGVGNSGKIASAFLLPGINCRTLINSHLTLLVEAGIFAGFVWGAAIFYALLNGIKKAAAPWCAFAGLVLSGFVSSIFDWDVLFDLYKFGELSRLNFYLSWILLLWFAGLTVYLILGKLNYKKLIISLLLTLVLIFGGFGFYSKITPKIRSGFIVKESEVMPLVLYDETWQIKNILPYLNQNQGYILPLSSGFHEYPSAPVYFFGNASEYKIKYPDARHYFF